MRPDSTLAALKISSTRARALPSGASNSKREPATRFNTSAHSRNVGSFNFQNEFKQPKVMWPLACAGSAPTAGSVAPGS